MGDLPCLQKRDSGLGDSPRLMIYILHYLEGPKLWKFMVYIRGNAGFISSTVVLLVLEEGTVLVLAILESRTFSGG